MLWMYGEPVGYRYIEKLLELLMLETRSSDVYVKFKFKYHIPRRAPVTGLAGPMYHDCVLEGRRHEALRVFDQTVRTQFIATCPCSKELSLDSESIQGVRGAPHMQRGFAKIRTRLFCESNPLSFSDDNLLWIEDVVAGVERVIKTVPYPIVKRVDEQQIAISCWDSPVFVEDATRDISLWLDSDPRVLDYVVVVENEESIHGHSAVAVQPKGIPGGLT
jgi:GTP cyclohydrolase I